MGSLSPLVVHGQLVWQIVLLVFAATGLTLAWVLPRRALLRRSARIRDGLGAPEKSLDASARNKPVVLIGSVKKPDDLREQEGSEGSRLVAATLAPQGMELAEEPSQKALTAVISGAPLVVEVDGQRVFVEGSPQILVGSHETGNVISPKRVRLTLWELASELRAMKNAPFALRTVSEGDRVRIAGVLRHEPDATTPQSYRSGSGAYFLAPNEGEGKTGFVPVAYEGSPKPLARSRWVVTAQTLAGPACAIALLGAVGELAIRAASTSESAAAVAAVTPFRRADGLAALRAHVDLGEHASDETLARAARIDRVRGFCGTASDDYLFANRPAQAAEIAEACGDSFRAARAYFVNGELERASTAFLKARQHDPKLPPSISEVTAYLVANKADEAATAGHALLASWDGPRGTREELQCVVDALDDRAAGTHEKGALEKHAEEEGTRSHCNLLLVDLRGSEVRKRASEILRYAYDPHTDPIRLALLDSVPRDQGNLGNAQADNYRRDRQSYYSAPASAITLFTQPKQVAFEMPQALAVEVFRGMEGRTDSVALVSFADLGIRRATFRSFLGDEAGALAALDDLDQKLAPFTHRTYTDAQKNEWESRSWRVANDDYEKYQRSLAAEEERLRKFYDPDKDEAERAVENLARASRDMRASVLLRAGKAAEAKTLLSDPKRGPFQLVQTTDLFRTFLDARASHDPRAQENLARGDGRESNRKLWLAAETGDGQALAARLREQKGDGRGIVDIVGAHLPEGRPALAHWVRFEYPAPCTTCGLYPLLNHLASRHDAAAAVSDEATVNELAALRTRLDPVLARRDIALVLHFLSELSPP